MEKVEQARGLGKDETSLINTCAILSAFMYLDTQDARYTGRTLKELVFDKDFISQADPKGLSTIKDAISSDPSLGEVSILSQSKVDNLNIPKSAPYSGFGPELVIANAFVLGGGDICVAYRGTGAGKWIDNGQAFGQEKTVMQEAAVRYFDYVVEQFGKNNNEKYYVTGHSKGGNKAQYVCMTSKHNHAISHCYEFDGQGFSPEAIEKFKDINGRIQRYDTQIDKITAICGKNDYVNPLGTSIVKPENMYYVQTVNSALNMAGYHDIFYMFNQESPGRVNFKYDKFGHALSVEQGNLGRCAANLSESFMKMNAHERGDCGIAMMSVIDKFSDAGQGTGDIKNASLENTLTFMRKGVPVLSRASINKSTFDSVYGLCHNLIKEGTEDKKFGKIVGALGMGALYIAYYAVNLPLSKVVGGIKLLSAAAVHGIKSIGIKIRERIDMIKKIESDVENKMMQEYYERIQGNYEADVQQKSLRHDWKVRMSGLETNIPELAVVIAATSVEQYLYHANQLAGGSDSHTMISYVNIVSELGAKYGDGRINKDIQKEALYIAEHKAIECIKRGENVMLFLPNMYEPVFRAQVNADISKALKDSRYTSTAKVLDNIDDNMIKSTNRNFAAYMDKHISNTAKELLEKHPPSTEDKNCKYDFVISEDFNKDQIITGLNTAEVITITEYLDALDEAYREVLGGCNLEEHELKNDLNSLEEEMKEDFVNDVNQLYMEDIDIDDIE